VEGIIPLKYVSQKAVHVLTQGAITLMFMSPHFYSLKLQYSVLQQLHLYSVKNCQVTATLWAPWTYVRDIPAGVLRHMDKGKLYYQSESVLFLCSCMYGLIIQSKHITHPQNLGPYSIWLLLVISHTYSTTWGQSAEQATLTFKRRIKSRLPFAGIIKSSPHSPRFQDKG